MMTSIMGNVKVKRSTNINRKRMCALGLARVKLLRTGDTKRAKTRETGLSHDDNRATRERLAVNHRFIGLDGMKAHLDLLSLFALL